ncbi:fumarate reductase (CoM/CoB) subunit TfrA [Methanobacterium paludis]|uniref:Succinate dehydrogenase (Ubiquinone) n=1 Tax=Methanobacterium paludis (strain DSM 25820 / JCM 18151 / SWAN1) TaxID=868131 RepID=F6D7M7_METPW|nr:fumarate reductase (CoM/CoB) subunit TfrA [Methanobacterium paludis]AEG17106.1 Succinate dehydrogenase (ubiquinone) [Methanobacterium paludis]
MASEIIECDVLVIGSGGAGCRAAIEAHKHDLDVIIVSKGLSFRSGCTILAEGGYNAAFGYVDTEDSFEAHIHDTLKGGAYLNDSKLVKILVEQAPERLMELESYGALFDRQESGKLNQRPFGGQTYRRTCFQGDRTGHEMMMALKEEVIRQKIETVDEVMVTSLIMNEVGDAVIGACGVSLRNSDFMVFRAKSTVITTGGAGWLYPVTSNAVQKTGDGYALAYNAGADLIDMEQVQFHPTGMLYPESRKGVLVTEAVRGEGGRLINSEGERFMKNYDPRGELATRDIVARAIYNEIREGRGTENGGVYLDVTHLPAELIEEKLETMLLQFQDVGVDIRKEPMEVAPTAHHFMGGSRINPLCETKVKNLYAAGEAAGGVHGANRLGGNALAETQVFGKIAGESAAKNALKTEFSSNNGFVNAEEERIHSLFKDGDYYPHEIKKELRETMWNNVAIIRNETDLKVAMGKLMEIKEKIANMKVPEGTGFNKNLQDALEIENMLIVAALTTESALMRRESRGSHYREDYPDRDERWKRSIVLNKNRDFRYIKR